MASLSSLYKKRKGTEQAPKTLDADSIVQMFLNVAPKVNVFSVNSRIFAKSSMNMPMMARDTNITRQNIAKLVKLQGDSPVKKADSFFERASEREKLYESNFSKESKVLKGSESSQIKISGFAQKAVDFGAMSLGLVGFFGAIALAGNLISKIPGGLDGMKDMFVALAEGLSAFSIDSFVKFGALLAAGALFGTVTGLKTKGGAMLGMGAIGLGIGLFFSGLAVGGEIGDLIGNSSGIKDMMVNFAEGLNAFNPSSLVAFGSLLGVGALFGAVTGLSAKGGAMLGIGAVGLGIGLFFSGLATGGALASMFTSNPTMIKDLLINLAEGLNALSQINGSALLPVIGVLPLFGGSLVAFLGMQGIGKIIDSLATGLDKAINFLIGEKDHKSPMQKIADDMKKISEVGDTTKASDGVKNLLDTLRIIADLSGGTIQNAINRMGLILSILERLNAGKFPTRPGQTPPAQNAPPGPSRVPANPPTNTKPTPDTSTQELKLGPNGEFENSKKGREQFLARMYPLAVEVSKNFNGVDPNAFLTQWGFESAWGSKPTGKYNYYGIKADPSWKGQKSDNMTTEYLNGERKVLSQPFRSYNSLEEGVADYVNFLKTNPRYAKAGLFQASTTEDFFGALGRASYATDPNYIKKLIGATEGTKQKVASLGAAGGVTTASLTPSAPSTGSGIASSSSAITQANLAMNTVPPTVVINADKEKEKKNPNQETRIASTIDFDFTDSMLGTVAA